jgi:hypothetical protein
MVWLYEVTEIKNGPVDEIKRVKKGKDTHFGGYRQIKYLDATGATEEGVFDLCK